MRSLCIAMKRSLRSQLEKARTEQQRPTQAKSKYTHFKTGMKLWDLPGGPVAKTQHSQWSLGFVPG